MSSQQWDPQSYGQNAGFVAELGRDVVALLSPQPGERVLDLGCGDGALTEQLVLAGCTVVGVDSSTAQVAGARARGLDARVLSGESLPFDAEFDAVFSNAALHWMRAADAVVSSVHRALRPGGRFVGELGGAGNVDTVRRALTGALTRRGLDAMARPLAVSDAGLVSGAAGASRIPRQIDVVVSTRYDRADGHRGLARDLRPAVSGAL